MDTWIIALAIAAAVVVWVKLIGRFSGYFNRIIGILLFGVLAYITIVSIIAVAFHGAMSVDEIIARLL